MQTALLEVEPTRCERSPAGPRCAGRLTAVCTSPGGIPKLPRDGANATRDGLLGDGRNHAKHLRPERAISLFDLEILQDLVREGFPLSPGAAGENLTVEGLHVQALPPGTVLQIGEVLLRLEERRKPCYVLDAINPQLKDVIVGRCGYMASVLRGGDLHAGMLVHRLTDVDSVSSSRSSVRSSQADRCEPVG